MKTNIIIFFVTCGLVAYVNCGETLNLPLTPGEINGDPYWHDHGTIPPPPRAAQIKLIKMRNHGMGCTGQRYDPSYTPSELIPDRDCFNKPFIAQPPPEIFSYQREMNLLCKCNEGFVRGPDDECILSCACPNAKPPSQVEYECPANQHYEACGPSCEKICLNEKPSETKCFKANSDNCFCNEGFYRYRDGDGPCVKSCQQTIITFPFNAIPKNTWGDNLHVVTVLGASQPESSKIDNLLGRLIQGLYELVMSIFKILL